MIFHAIGYRKPGDEGLEAIYQQEDQRIAEGASCFVRGGPLGGSPSSVGRALIARWNYTPSVLCTWGVPDARGKRGRR